MPCSCRSLQCKLPYAVPVTGSKHHKAVSHLLLPEVSASAYLLFSLALDLFRDFGNGVAAVALTGAYKAGEVAPVPVAEALL